MADEAGLETACNSLVVKTLVCVTLPLMKTSVVITFCVLLMVALGVVRAEGSRLADDLPTDTEELVGGTDGCEGVLEPKLVVVGCSGEDDDCDGGVDTGSKVLVGFSSVESEAAEDDVKGVWVSMFVDDGDGDDVSETVGALETVKAAEAVEDWAAELAEDPVPLGTFCRY